MKQLTNKLSYTILQTLKYSANNDFLCELGIFLNFSKDGELTKSWTTSMLTTFIRKNKQKIILKKNYFFFSNKWRPGHIKGVGCTQEA